MDDTEKYFTVKAMEAYGGGFASALAGAYARADRSNTQRIEAAFPDLMQAYGPGSRFYEAVSANLGA